MSSTKKKGDLIVISIKEGDTGEYKLIAAATNHTLTLTGETSSISTKDDYQDGIVWNNQEMTSLSWEATTENMVSLADDTAAGMATYDTLCDAMTTGTKVKVKLFERKTDGTEQASAAAIVKPRIGEAYITSLQLNAPSGDNASFSATFSGVGQLKKETDIDKQI